MSKQVYVYDRSDRVVLGTQKRVANYDGRVIDEHVDRTQFEFHINDQFAYLGADRHVHRVRLDRGPRDSVGDHSQRLVVVCLIHVHARQLGAQLSELYGQFASQAPAGSRDLSQIKQTACESSTVNLGVRMVLSV